MLVLPRAPLLPKYQQLINQMDEIAIAFLKNDCQLRNSIKQLEMSYFLKDLWLNYLLWWDWKHENNLCKPLKRSAMPFLCFIMKRYYSLRTAFHSGIKQFSITGQGKHRIPIWGSDSQNLNSRAESVPWSIIFTEWQWSLLYEEMWKLPQHQGKTTISNKISNKINKTPQINAKA